MEKIDELNPHYCEHDTHEDWLVRFYERFGFELHEGPLLLLDHRPTSDRLSAYVEKRRKQLKEHIESRSADELTI